MVKKNQSLIYKILNVWAAFAALLFLISFLPHWEEMPLQGWINVSLYFFLFLISFSIVLKEKNNKDVFLNLSIFFLAYTSSFINIYIGEGYLFGDDNLKYIYYLYKQLTFSFLFNFVIVYISLKHLFIKLKQKHLYLLVFAITIPVFIYNYLPYLINPSRIFRYGEGTKFLAHLFKCQFQFHLFAFIFLILYGYSLFKKDFVIGRYINSLMAFFFIFLIIEMIDLLSYVYGFRIFSISQYILTFNLLFLSGILFRKLIYTYSEYGQFYESMIAQRGKLGNISIQQHGAEKQFLVLRFIKLYISKRRNYLLTLTVLTGMGIAYFQFPKFFTINILAFAGSGVLLFAFMGALYRKRSAKNFLIS